MSFYRAKIVIKSNLGNSKRKKTIKKIEPIFFDEKDILIVQKKLYSNNEYKNFESNILLMKNIDTKFVIELITKEEYDQYMLKLNKTKLKEQIKNKRIKLNKQKTKVKKQKARIKKQREKLKKQKDKLIKQKEKLNKQKNKFLKQKEKLNKQ